MIARRLRLAFLNVQAAAEALPTIVDIMAEELNWSEAEKKVTVLNRDLDGSMWNKQLIAHCRAISKNHWIFFNLRSFHVFILWGFWVL